MLSFTSPMLSMLPDFDYLPTGPCRRPSAVLRLLVDDQDADDNHSRSQVAKKNSHRLLAPAHVRPNYRVQSTDSASRISIELPGVARSDVDVQVHGRRLTVRGARFNTNTTDRLGASGPAIARTEAPDSTPTSAAGPDSAHGGSGAAMPSRDSPSKDAPRAENTHAPNAQHPAKHENGHEQQQDSSQNGAHTDARTPPTPALVFTLTLTLAPDADPDAVSVHSYADGVLVLNVPNRRPAAPRKLAVQ